MGNGINVDSWAKIEGDCHIEYDVFAGETQFRLGGSSPGLDLVFTEESLARMAEKCADALREMRVPEVDGDQGSAATAQGEAE